MNKFIISMLSQGGISSKRFWASVILAMLCASYTYCTIRTTEMPEATYGFLSLAAVLLGIETVFNKPTKTTTDE